MNPLKSIYLLSLILSIIGPTNINAQQVADAWVYGGNNNLNSFNCYVDNLGNRYQVVYTNQSTLEIDSFGYTKTLAPNNSLIIARTVIIKFNGDGKYLYHINIPYSAGDYSTNLTFDADNNAYFCGKIYNNNSSYTLFDALNNSYTLNTSPVPSNGSTLLCKLAENGTFDWIRTIYRKSGTDAPLNRRTYLCEILYFNPSKNEIKLIIPNYKPVNTVTLDTLLITSNNNLFDTVVVNSILPQFTFSTNGQLIKQLEILKNQLNNTCDGIGSFNNGASFNSIRYYQHKKHSYLFVPLELYADDTLVFNLSIPLNQGYNFVLICMNDDDSVLWAKSITRGSNISFMDIASDTTKSNIDLIIYYNPTYDIITFDPSLNNGVSSNVYAIKLNPLTGVISSTKTILTNVNNSSSSCRKVSWNYIAQKYFYSTSNSFGFLDSNFKLLSIHQVNPGIGGLFNNVNSTQLHIDKKGYAYVTGSIYDSINYSCFSRYANPNHSYRKVVVTKIAPLITIDSTACKPITSPSGRYLWDTSGVYYDTIPSITNCDSVLEIRFTNLSSNMNYDTSVQVFMQSPSGKYIWDSAGIYNDTLTNKFGCDSVIIFNLKVLQTQHTIDTNVCNKYLSPSGLYWFDSTGTYTDTIPNTAGADSIIKINLRVLTSFSNLDTTFCGTISSPSGKYVYSNTGIYSDTITNTVGCDSIIKIRFNLQQTKDTITVNTCNSYMSPSAKYTYIQTGIYTDTLQTSLGCDSIIWIYYTNQKTTDTINVQSCDTAISPSGKFIMRLNGNYIDTLTNKSGCDSILFIQFTRDTFSVYLSKSNNISCDSPTTYLTTSAGNIFTWFENESLLAEKSATIAVAPNNHTLYKVIAQNNLGCLATDSIVVDVNKKDSTVTFPNVFTPNNDGTNDCYSVNGVETYNKIMFEVYNRWGQLIFKTNNPIFCWNGITNNGEEVLSGTYYFIFEGISNCGNLLKTNGTITVIR